MSQFSIWWKRNSQRYIPDFVVETKGTIYMVEIKAERDINDEEVSEKAEAGEKYCETAGEFNAEHKGKKWKYILIPHTAIAPNMSFKGFCK